MDTRIVNIHEADKFKLIKTLSPYFIVAAVSLAYLSHYTHYLFVTDVANDEEVMSGAWRIIHGQVIYRDFFEIFAPGNFFLLALIYKLFGYGLIITNKALIVLDVICNILLFQISSMVLKRWYAIIPPLLFLTIGFPSWFIFSHYWTTSVTLLTAIIFLSVYMEKLTSTSKSNNLFLFLSGLFVGLTGIFLQSTGVYTTVILLIVIYLRTKKLHGEFKRILIFGTGIIVPVSGFVLYLLLNNAFTAFIHNQIILLEMYPTTTYFFAKPLMSLYNLVTPIKLIFIISFVGSLILLIFTRDASDTEIIFFAGNIICFLTAWQRLTVGTLGTAYTTTSLSFIFIFYLIILFIRHIKDRHSGLIYKLANLLVHGAFIAIAAASLIIIYKDISNIKTKAFHFLLRDTAYWTYDEKGAEDLIKFHKESKKMLGNDKEVFAYPLASTLYMLLDLNNPTNYDVMLGFGRAASAPADVLKDVTNQLVSTKTKFIITYQWSYRFLLIWSQRNGVVFEPNMLENFIWDNYTDVLHVGLYTLWELRALKPGDTIAITVKGHPELNETATVTNAGYIRGPDRSETKVEGLPLYHVKDLYAKMMSNYGITSNDVGIAPYKEHEFNTSENFMTSPSPFTLSGDCIFWVLNQSICYSVPYTRNNIASISPKTISVTVTGAVRHAGTLTLNDGARLADTFTLTGGHIPSADFSNIVIIRHHKEIRADLLKYVRTKDQAYNPLLRNHDTVYINSVPHRTISVTVTGAVRHAGTLTLNDGARLADTFPATGGLLPVSNLRSITILRKDRLIKADFLQYIRTRNTAYNPPLENNDIVSIPKGNEHPDINDIREAAKALILKGKK
ncbi:MAG: SLBB domain-containing protein [Deltaproteobacteria bacterium]|nr:SLBB domain-containing protein [Deltaproteobacteria bacterium]MCL5276282.1 SLBB domain-containing protein [Deltaproteobacteria bacterium]